MITVIKGNEREVPPDIPISVWWDRVAEYAAEDTILSFPWYHADLEVLTPTELRRMKAKALVWLEVTGALPDDIKVWWEIRQARNRGDLPLTMERAASRIDSDGVLWCGECGARWSAPYAERCRLCGLLFEIVENLAEGTDDNGIEYIRD